MQAVWAHAKHVGPSFILLVLSADNAEGSVRCTSVAGGAEAAVLEAADQARPVQERYVPSGRLQKAPWTSREVATGGRSEPHSRCRRLVKKANDAPERVCS